MMEKETVVLLHGNSGSSRDMAVIAELLNGSYPVLNLDLPLHGANTAPVEELSIQFCKESIETFLLEQGLNRISIVGYSDGANIAAELCGSSALQVKTCFLISPNTHYQGTVLPWRVLFHLIQGFCYPFRFSQSMNVVYQRMGMMLNYIMDPTIQRHAEAFHLYFAQNDMITVSDQLKMEEILGVKRSVIANKTHLNIVHSTELMDEVERVFEIPG
jgi:pimeloyl-ACP methyl ester carboxylesterase